MLFSIPDSIPKLYAFISPINKLITPAKISIVANAKILNNISLPDFLIKSYTNVKTLLFLSIINNNIFEIEKLKKNIRKNVHIKKTEFTASYTPLNNLSSHTSIIMSQYFNLSNTRIMVKLPNIMFLWMLHNFLY